jgi:hypothetical protein
MATKKKKKAPTQPQQQVSPKNYILTGRARKLPIAECWISSDWKEQGLITIVVARQHTTGNMTFGIYLVDMYCLGLKNTNAVFSKPHYDYEALLEDMYSQHEEGRERIDYVLAHNIIYGAIAYAEDLGFKPEKDWALSQFILEEDTDDIELIEVEFGKDGQPFFISGPYDNVNSIIAKLDKSVGAGNYHYLAELQGLSDFSIDDDFDDDEDDDDDFVAAYDFGNKDDAQDTEYEEVKS